MISMHLLLFFLNVFHYTAGRCPPVPSLHMAKPDGMSAEPSSVISYMCEFGFMWSTRERELRLVCQDGVWNETQDITCIGGFVSDSNKSSSCFQFVAFIVIKINC